MPFGRPRGLSLVDPHPSGLAAAALQAFVPLVLTWLTAGVGALLALSLLAKAWLDAPLTWDVWYYHLPFAARLAGITSADDYAFHALNQARFEGFPLLAERLQGFFWRVSGRPEAANLVAYGALALYTAFLKRVFDVPAALAFVALLGVPLVQMHATTCYIDLPANLALSVVVLAVAKMAIDQKQANVNAREQFLLAQKLEQLVNGGQHERRVSPKPAKGHEQTGNHGVFSVSPSLVALAVGAAAASANMRFQLTPAVALALLLSVPFAWRSFRPWVSAAFLVAGATVVFASPLANMWRFGNPVYPMRFSILGRVLPYAEDVYSAIPPWLAGYPAPFRFLASLLEVGIRPITDPARWSVDQWMEAADGNRMGGFFSAYVIVNVAFLVWGFRRVGSTTSRVGASAVALTTLVASFSPQCHELRYYLFWMIVLVSINLAIAVDAAKRGHRMAPSLMQVIALSSALTVIVATRAYFVWPLGYGVRDLVRDKVSASRVASAILLANQGSRACFYAEPWTFLHAALFYRPARYALQEGETPEFCAERGAQFLP